MREFAVANPWIDAPPSILTNGAKNRGRNRARWRENGDETRAQNGHGWLGVEDIVEGPAVSVPATNRE